MAKNFLIALLLIVAFGCKKDKFSNDDTNLYKWKRELYRARVSNDGPATFNSRDPKVNQNQDAVLIGTDQVTLTEYRRDKQQDSIFRASGKTQIYKYEKLEKVNN